MKTTTSLLAALLALLTLATACADFDDATQPATVQVQLVQPATFTGTADLSGKTVTLAIGAQTISATTDGHGLATFTGIVPDVYDISTSWTISGDEYRAATGTAEVVRSATVSGSLNTQLVTGDAPLTLATQASPDRDIIIGKVFYAGSKDLNRRNYQAGKYIELYNQSDDSIDVAGLYIGLTETQSTPAYTLDNIATKYGEGAAVLLKQLYRIPADRPHLVAPGGTVVITNSAIDHTANDTMEHNLLDADFEVKDTRGTYTNNPDTPAMEMVYQAYAGTSVMNILQGGPCGVVIFRTDDDVEQWEKVYAYGKSSGMQFLVCPTAIILDGFEALANKTKGIDVATKRLAPNIDAGYTYINAATGWSGETVYRRTASRTPAGRRILTDTNNSSNDFTVSTKIQPREYDD